jgi:predicted lipid-binding transport protein (Tim44 family)
VRSAQAVFGERLKEMDGVMVQLMVLAGVAIFLVLRLRSLLGTRTGYEQNPDELRSRAPASDGGDASAPSEVIEGGGVDQDIADHVDPDSDDGKALAAMKRIEPSFHVSDFLAGARGAYEMILMAYENGDLDTLEQFLAPDVYAGFRAAVEAREEQGLEVEAQFIGVGEVTLKKAQFDEMDNVGDLTIRFVGEMTTVVRDSEGNIVEGDPNTVKKQKDLWTFSRVMGSDNPNWLLVATGE